MTEKKEHKPVAVSQDTAVKHSTKLTRRQALLSALFASAVSTAEAATDGSCACLPPPNCDAVCPNGGVPRGDGTQACECNVNPPAPDFPRALGVTDGGDAVNSIRWNGYELRNQNNPNATRIAVLDNGVVDFIEKSSIAGTLPEMGAEILYGATVFKTVGSSGYEKIKTTYPAVKRDLYGRVEAVGAVDVWTQCNCNCSSNCCNCGDDSRCFVKAQLRTTTGVKDVSEVIVGDRLIGVDGIHTVVGLLHGRLGKRKAVCPRGNQDVVVTEDHVVLHQGHPVVYSELGKRMCHEILTSESGIKGVYIQPWMDNLISIDPESFDCVDMPEETPTYTVIVSEGNWAMTEDGTSVLLCQML